MKIKYHVSLSGITVAVAVCFRSQASRREIYVARDTNERDIVRHDVLDHTSRKMRGVEGSGCDHVVLDHEVDGTEIGHGSIIDKGHLGIGVTTIFG